MQECDAVAGEAIYNVRILVVDDNPHMRSLLQAILRAFGFKHVHGEPDGQAGFAALQHLKPDLVFTDYSMTPMDGLEFVRQVRGLKPPLALVPIIMVTGHNERKYVERARDAGITEVLCKPVTPQGMFLRIREVVERPRAFVRVADFAGPDRRRSKVRAAPPVKRRSSDFDVGELDFV